MAKNISPQEAADRLTEAGLRLTDRYSRGTQGKGQKWASGAAASEGNYEAGVQAAISAKRFGKGISAAGGAAYDEGVRNKGTNNWGSGLQMSGSKYIKKIQPYVALWSASLPTPRGAKGSPQNEKRVLDNIKRFKDVRK